MYSLHSFLEKYRPTGVEEVDDSPKRGGTPTEAKQGKGKKFKGGKDQNLTMGTVKQADLQGKKMNPYQKPQPPSKTQSEVIKKMMPGK